LSTRFRCVIEQIQYKYNITHSPNCVVIVVVVISMLLIHLGYVIATKCIVDIIQTCYYDRYNVNILQVCYFKYVILSMLF